MRRIAAKEYFIRKQLLVAIFGASLIYAVFVMIYFYDEDGINGSAKIYNFSLVYQPAILNIVCFSKLTSKPYHIIITGTKRSLQ